MRYNTMFVACLSNLLADLLEAEAGWLDSPWIDDAGDLTDVCREKYDLYHRLLKVAANGAGVMVKAGGAAACGPETPEDLHTIAEGLRSWGNSLQVSPIA